jgi:hypothetical protein
MYRLIINLLYKKILYIKLVNCYDYTEMRGQQNIKICVCAYSTVKKKMLI